MSRWTVVREKLFSPVGLHAVGFGILAIATIILAVRVGLDWRATSSSNVDALAGRQVELRTLQVQTAPLRGLDKKVDLSRKQIDDFYEKRIPPSYSAVLERLGQLQSKAPVRLTRVGYTQAPGSGDLIRDPHGCGIEWGLSGDHALCERAGTQPDIFHDSRNGFERATERDGEPALAVFDVAEAGGRCGRGRQRSSGWR